MPRYKVIAREALPDRSGAQPAEIVLCSLPDNSITPYVTWQRNIPEKGGDGDLYWGHYCYDFKEAMEDFSKRIK